MPLPDYYEIFDIDRAADAASVDKAIKNARRRWRQLAGSPDKERARQADLRMGQLDDAEASLLDPENRAAYDRSLASQPEPEPQPTPASSVAPATSATGWGQRAYDYYFAGDVRNAYTAAKKGTDADPDDTVAWLTYVWSATDLKRYEDADFASSELVSRAPQLETSHELRGSVLDAMGRHAEAEKAFRKAAAINPGKVYYQGRAAWAMLDQGRIDQALTEAWQLIERFPGEEYPAKVVRAASEALRERHRPQDALAAIWRLVDVGPDDETVLGVVLAIQDVQRAGDLETARSAAWTLLEKFPANPRAQKVVRFVIENLRNRELFDPSLADARRLLARYPNDQDTKEAFALSRLAEAESKLSTSAAGSSVLVNKAQASALSEALDEVDSLGLTGPSTREILRRRREYLASQTKTKVTLSFGRLILGALATILTIVGLTTLAGGGWFWLLVGLALGWWFFAITVKKQYQLTAKTVGPRVGKTGLQR